MALDGFNQHFQAAARCSKPRQHQPSLLGFRTWGRRVGGKNAIDCAMWPQRTSLFTDHVLFIIDQY